MNRRDEWRKKAMKEAETFVPDLSRSEENTSDQDKEEEDQED